MRELEQGYLQDVEDSFGAMRSRFIYLVPLNMVLCYAALKSPRYINKLTQKYILRGRTPHYKTMLPVSLAQSIGLTSLIFGSNFLVLGFNPFAMVKRLNNQWAELEKEL